MTEHPMLPTNEQLSQWESDWFSERENADALLINAYAAGADAQLQECVEWLHVNMFGRTARDLRSAMRPKPPSLKQQALEHLSQLDFGAPPQPEQLITIRRALEALPDDN